MWSAREFYSHKSVIINIHDPIFYLYIHSATEWGLVGFSGGDGEIMVEMHFNYIAFYHIVGYREAY